MSCLFLYLFILLDPQEFPPDAHKANPASRVGDLNRESRCATSLAASRSQHRNRLARPHRIMGGPSHEVEESRKTDGCEVNGITNSYSHGKGSSIHARHVAGQNNKSVMIVKIDEE